MNQLPKKQDYFWEGCEIDNGGELLKKFIVPPFSILDTKQGYWQERKRQWLSIGLQSELGRAGLANTCVGGNVPDYMANRGNNEGGSIFDPVLCELMYS